jgi:hypothetical protein
VDLPSASAATFSDMQGHWAQKAVSRAASLDFISGYPDGQFKPDQEISQIEALVLFMRAEGINLKDTNDQTKSDKKTANVKTPAISWGQSYLDEAAKDDFLSTDEVASFKPDAPETRAQAAELLSRILQLPLSDSGNTTFADLSACPQNCRKYIGAVATAKIMSGFQDGTFGPDLSIKRGEAAAVLSNLIEQKWAKPSAIRCLAGWIKKIDQQKNESDIELVSLQGTQKVKLASDVQCYKGEQTCQPAEAVNYRAEVLLDSKQQAVFIDLLEQRSNLASDEQITGTVKSVALGKESQLVISDLNCQEKNLPLSWDAEISSSSKNNNTKGFQSLTPQTFVRVSLTNGEVTGVTLLETKSISGTVEALSGNRLTLNGKTNAIGIPNSFNYWDTARIVDKNGVRAGNVEIGTKVKITYLDPIPGEIDDEIALEIMITN